MPLTGDLATPVASTEFAAWMAPLAPFEPTPALAVAVSGGPDSLALALCARDWAAGRAGTVLALVVDHGLRASSAAEAAATRQRLAGVGIPSVLLRLSVPPGTALAARARAARYAALAEAAAARGILHVLLGHHAGDQAETLLIRVLAASGPAGLAGMAALREADAVRWLRPLLAVAPARLKATLRAAGLAWVEDPSNTALPPLRGRMRRWRDDAAGTGRATRRLVTEAEAAGADRAAAERAAAQVLATAAIRPEGFALLPPGGLSAAALAAILQAVSGSRYPPPPAAAATLAAKLRPATLAGAQVLQAGRLGAGWLVVREAAAMAAPVPAHGGSWDGRFRLTGWRDSGREHTLGALGTDAWRFRDESDLPAAVLRTLPALRRDGEVVAVPAIGYCSDARCAPARTPFAPPRAAAPAVFVPAASFLQGIGDGGARRGCMSRPDALCVADDQGKVDLLTPRAPASRVDRKDGPRTRT